MNSSDDIRFMRRAIELAQRGEGAVNPNPLVGAVIVRNGRIIGAGWHEKWGAPHAERNALARCSEPAAGATVYVTLEPCCHHGKTPPCTDALIAAGVKRVVVAMLDPNPLVAGKGVEQLRKAGIEVESGLLEEEARYQNRVFLKYITEQRPWVVAKSAMTLDGKIATYTGDSKWVTGEEARKRVHQLRNQYMAIMVGRGTVEADDPMLNCRLDGNVCQPIRVIVDSSTSLRMDSNIVKSADKLRTIVAHTSKADGERIEKLRGAGIETICCSERESKVDLSDLMAQLAIKGIDSILVEGGGELNFSLYEQGLVDEVVCFVAPKIVGGSSAKSPVEGKGLELMAQALELCDVKCEMVGEDIMISGLINK